MLNYFWTYETELPSKVQWKLFGREHILWLMILIGAGILFLLRNQRQKKAMGTGTEITKNRSGSRMFYGTAFFSLFWQIAQAVYRIALGVYDIGTLPLHICSLASYLVFLYAVTNWNWLGEILYFPLLPGAFLAILFPDWTMYPAFSFMSIAGFLVHWSIDMAVIFAMQSGRLRPSVRRIGAPIAFLSIYAAILIPFDRHFHVNYGFLNIPSPGSPLVAIADIFGHGVGYYFGYALIVAVCMAAAYILVWIISRKHETA